MNEATHTPAAAKTTVRSRSHELSEAGLEVAGNALRVAASDPMAFFAQDAVRMVRAVCLSVCWGLPMESRAQEALVRSAPLLKDVAADRLGLALDALVRSGRAGRALLEQPDVMCAALPELVPARGFDQHSIYHVFDVYEHIAHVCCACEAFSVGLALPELRWAALLHDVAKPMTYSQDVSGRGHFFDHPRQGAEVARQMMRRLGIAEEITQAACVLIRLHDERMPATVSAVRRLLARMSKACPGREVPLAFALFDLRRADAVSKCSSAAAWAHQMDDYTRILRKEVARGPVFALHHLAIDGADLGLMRSARGDLAVRMQLEQLLRAVMADEVTNDRCTLLAWLGEEDV